MGTGNIFKTDLYYLYDYVSNPAITYPKELFVETLREFFSQDTTYHYQRDVWGFPLITDHTNEKQEAGFVDNTTSRLFIGEAFRNDQDFYPALIIKHGGTKSVQIAFNRNKYSVQWENTIFEDGYGNRKIIKTPAYFERNGAWEGSIIIDVQSRNSRSADELSELVAINFVDRSFDDMKNSGVVILGSPNISSPSELFDRTGKIHKRTVTFDIRSEWCWQSKINNVIDIVNLCFDIGNINTQIFSPNLAINVQNLLEL